MIAEQDQAGYGPGASDAGRPVALVTGVGRTAGIGAGIAGQLAASGWDIVFTYWTRYDERMAWGIEPGAAEAIRKSLAGRGAATVAIEADLALTDAPARIFDAATPRTWWTSCARRGDSGLTASS
jgi:3-oxoacyl-[acyl-carrier protein] reductase